MNEDQRSSNKPTSSSFGEIAKLLRQLTKEICCLPARIKATEGTSYAQGRIIITENEWSPDPLILSYTITVTDITGGKPTYIDSFSNPTDLEDNEVVTWSGGGLSNDGVPIVSVPALSSVLIVYTQKVV